MRRDDMREDKRQPVLAFPEEVQERRVFSLIEVCNSLRKTIAARYGSAFWLRAEMHKLNYYPPSGRVFPNSAKRPTTASWPRCAPRCGARTTGVFRNVSNN